MGWTKATATDVEKTIKLLKKMKKVVSKLNKVYEKANMNEIQPPTMDDCLKHSLEEWPHYFQQAIHEWEGVKANL